MDEEKIPVFRLKEMFMQTLDDDGQAVGEEVRVDARFTLEELWETQRKLRARMLKIYYILNQYVPARNAKGEIVYFQIPTASFAQNNEERERIIEPEDVFVIHPSNLINLRLKAAEGGFLIEEWEWGKMTLRPTHPLP